MSELLKEFKQYLRENEESYKNGARDSIEYPLGYEEVKLLLNEIERLNNIINELEKYCNEEIEDYDKNIKSQYVTDITKEQYEGEKVCFEDMLYKIKELKGEIK